MYVTRVAQGATQAATAEHRGSKTSISNTPGLVWLHRVEGQRKVKAYGLLAWVRGVALLGSRTGIPGMSRKSHLGG